MLPVTVIQHPKERISKCSLRSLMGRDDITFLKAHSGFKFDATGFILLALDAPSLNRGDAGCPLLILDSTWRLLPKLERCVAGEPVRRSIPSKAGTAYPRRSKLFVDPEWGLASIEALYAAKRILGEDDPSILDGYAWKDAFLANLDRVDM